MSTNGTKLDNLVNFEKVNIVLKVSTLLSIIGGVWVIAQRSATLDKIAEEVRGIKTEITQMNATVQKQSLDIAVLKNKAGIN